MLVGRWLFHPVDGGDDWTLEADHLTRMMEHTSEKFTQDMMARAQLGSHYLDEEGLFDYTALVMADIYIALVAGNLRRVPDFFPVSIKAVLQNCNILSLEEVDSAADFIQTCIRLDPGDRPSAEQLSHHPWLQFCPGPDDTVCA